MVLDSSNDRWVWTSDEITVVLPGTVSDENPYHDPKTGEFTFAHGTTAVPVKLRVPKSAVKGLAERKNIPSSWIAAQTGFKQVEQLRRGAAPILYSKTVTHAPSWIEWFGKRQRSLRSHDSADDEFVEVYLVMQVQGGDNA